MVILIASVLFSIEGLSENNIFTVACVDHNFYLSSSSECGLKYWEGKGSASVRSFLPSYHQNCSVPLICVSPRPIHRPLATLALKPIN
ncbi:hypothetical protein BKA69DRAFT_1104941 [Paraphysoderma sedebokerense]|nr:hypothetical protein BKA69DRAFT_1104941 [Paraphysoderma sedebokerense]